MNINNKKQLFEKQLKTYINEISNTHDIFELYVHIYNSRITYLNEINISPAFFSIVLYVLLSNTIIDLCKLYDNYNGHKRSDKNIISFLNFIHSNIVIFPCEDHILSKYNCSYKVTVELINKCRDDISSLSTILDKLFTWRDKLYAHYDNKYFNNRDQLRIDHPIKVEEFRKLISTAHHIFNVFSIPYNGVNHALESINLFDVDNIFEILKKHNENAR